MRAHHSQVDGALFCATVPGLRGVIASAPTPEACRDQLREVIEEWVLIRVALGLHVPALDDITMVVKAVKQASGCLRADRPHGKRRSPR